MNFGSWLNCVRKERNLTLNDVAQRIGLHRTHIYRWENGEKDITLGKFIILVQIGLEMELDEVLKLNIFESKNEGQTA